MTDGGKGWKLFVVKGAEKVEFRDVEARFGQAEAKAESRGSSEWKWLESKAQ